MSVGIGEASPRDSMAADQTTPGLGSASVSTPSWRDPRVLRRGRPYCRDPRDRPEARSRELAGRRRWAPIKKVPLSEVKDDLSRYLREAEREEVVITRHGRPAGLLIGFQSEDDWFDYLLEHDPRFLQKIETARRNLRAGKGTPLNEIEN